MPLQIAGFSGSLGHPSRTRALVELAVRRAAERHGALARVYDLTDLQPDLGAARSFEDLTGPARQSVDALLLADVLVVGSPVYKGSYSGLFKHLFDLIDPAAFAGKPVLLTATGGGEKHALVIEHQLRPLFAFFEAAVLPTGIYASAGDFAEGVPVSPPLLARLERGLDQLSAQLGAGRTVRAA